MGEKRIKIAGMRKAISNAMKNSVLNYPSATGVAKVDMTELLKMNESLMDMGIKVVMSAFYIKAIAIAMKDFPELNSRVENDEIIIYDSVNVGVATAVENGIYVLVVKDTQNKGLKQISDELKELIDKMKQGKITMDDLSGGTITLSNLSSGAYEAFSSIITNDQALIIGVAKMRKEVVVSDDDQILIKQRIPLMININHIITDGVPSSKFLDKMIEILENPLKYMDI